MTRRYYSSRNKPVSLTVDDLYWKLGNLYLLLRDKGFFKEKAGITERELPDSIKREAALALSFQPFPLTKWQEPDITEEHIFDILEFLYDHVSQPGRWVGMTTDTGWNYSDYESYDTAAGREEFRSRERGPRRLQVGV